MKQFRVIIIMVCIIALLVMTFQVNAPATVDTESLQNYGVPNPCYKWQDVSPFSVIQDRRIRQAHCEPIGKTGTVIEEQAIAQQAPVCTSLWLSTGPLYVGMLTGGGGVVTAIEGNWVIDVRGHVLMAKNGKSFTVTFPHNVMVQQLAILDNDPGIGESGWTLNGIVLPTTLDHEWRAVLDFNLTANTITFDKGQDSPHIGACIL